MALKRIYYVTDMHGSDVCFRKFLRAIEFYKVDIPIVGGDLTGKFLIPIVKKPDGMYSFNFLGQNLMVREEELKKAEERITINGGYYFYTKEDEMAEYKADPQKLDNLLTKLMIDRIRDWIQLADNYLRNKRVKIYVTGGNDDRFEIDPIFKESESIMDVEGQVVEIDSQHEMANTGYSNTTPWNCPRDVTEEELSKRIEGILTRVKNMENCVFNFHVPPIDSQLDTCVKLDTSVYPPKPMMKAGNPVMFGAGSKAVRNAIEKYQPLLGLHGHIHEARGGAKIGKTTCINPGSEYSEGILRGALVNYDEKKIRSYQLVAG